MDLGDMIEKSKRFVKLWEKFSLGSYEDEMQQIIHPDYRASTESLDNTWNEIWQDNIEPTIDFTHGIETLLERARQYGKHIRFHDKPRPFRVCRFMGVYRRIQID